MNQIEDRRRVLVIDDNETIFESIHSVLARQEDALGDALDDAAAQLFDDEESPIVIPGTHKENFEVDFAPQGLDGVQMIEAAEEEGLPYRLAFVDMKMPPGIDGVETIRRIFDQDRKLRVVLCTAYSDQPWAKVQAAARNSPRLTMVRKPFSGVEIEKIANSCFRHLETLVGEAWPHERQKYVLVVDQSAAMRAEIKGSIGFNNWTILEADNGVEALAVAQHYNVDLFIADIRLPLLNGIDLIRELRAMPRYAKTPAFVLTNEGAPELLAEGREVGVSSWLFKPFKPAVLRAALEHILSATARHAA